MSMEVEIRYQSHKFALYLKARYSLISHTSPDVNQKKSFGGEASQLSVKVYRKKWT